MTETIRVVEANDFDETDEECSIIGADNINNSIAILIICEGKTVLYHIKELSYDKQLTLKSILSELKLMGLEVLDIKFYIGSNLDRNRVIEQIDIQMPFTICYPYNTYGTDSIAYDCINAKTFGITNSKNGLELIDYSDITPKYVI